MTSPQPPVTTTGVSLDSLFRRASMPMLLISPASGKILDANDAACVFYGYARQDLCARQIFDLNTLPPDQVAEEMRRAVSENKNFFSFSHRLANGDIRQVEVSSTPIFDAPEAPLCSIIHDVTERTAAVARELRINQILHEQQQLLQTVLDATPNSALIALDLQGNVTLMNKVATQLTNHQPGELTGKPLPMTLLSASELSRLFMQWELTYGNRLESWSTLTDALRQTDIPSFACTIQNTRSEDIRMEVKLAPLHDEQQEIAGLLISAQDITTQEEAAEKLKLAASVFSEANEGIIITGTDASILDVNQAFCSTSGYRKDELIGRNPRLLKSGHQPPVFYAQMWQTLTATGHWQGELWNRRKNGEIYAEELTISAVKNRTGETTHYIGLLSDITDRKRQQASIEHLAYYDALTQLPNRILLGDRMRQALAHNARGHGLLAVCYLDLDDFKPVNDRYGHKSGDQLLVEVARRLQTGVRVQDTVARLGGDEFVIIMTDITNIEETDRILQRLLHDLRRAFHLEPQTDVHISASLGVAHFPLDGQDADTLLRHADQAMYVAKQHGRNRVHYFNPAQEEHIQQHHQFRQQVRKAINASEFRLQWQPWIDLRTGRTEGYEGLLRWHSEDENVWLPATFLERLNGDNLSLALGRQVLDIALQQLRIWHRAGFSPTISLNISLKQWETPHFCDRLKTMLNYYPEVNPEQICLEISEQDLIHHIDHLRQPLEQVRLAGLKIIIDNFGQSVGQQEYPYLTLCHAVKLSPYLSHDMLEDEQTLLHVQFLHNLCGKQNIRVIAKHLELIEQGVVFARLGIHLAQGYAIRAPHEADEITPLSESVSAAQWRPHFDASWPIEDSALALAIQEHRRWLNKLELLWKDGNPFPYLRAGTLDCCRLEHWMQHRGKRWAHLPDFLVLEKCHQEFRQLVSDTLQAINQPSRHVADPILQAESKLGEMAVAADALLADIIRNKQNETAE